MLDEKQQTNIILRIAGGLGANFYGQCITILCQLLGMPILLSSWGVGLYGEWLVLCAIPAYLSMTNLGFSLSAANDMTMRAARGDTAGVLTIFQSLYVLMCAIAVFGLFLVSILVAQMPTPDWLNFNQIDLISARSIVWFLSAEIFIKLIDGVYYAGFFANRGYAFHAQTYWTTLLLQNTAIWLTAIAGYGPVVAAGSFLFVRCCTTPIIGLILVYRYKYMRFGIQHARLSALRALLRPALANVAMPLGYAISIQGMILIIGMMLGPASVVIFSTLRTLTRIAVQMVLSVSQVLEPELARAWGAQDSGLLTRIYSDGFAVGFWLVLGETVALLFLGNTIITIWSNGMVQMDYSLYLCLLLSSLASVFWNGSLILLRALNRHLCAAAWYVQSSLIAIVLAVILLHLTGKLFYVGVSLLFMDGLMSVYLLRAGSRYVRISIPQLFLHAMNLARLIRLARGLVQRKPKAP